MKIYKTYIGQLFIIGVICCLVITAAAKKLGGLAFYVYPLFALEGGMFIVSLLHSKGKLYLTKKEGAIVALLTFSQIFSYLMTSIEFQVALFDFHKTVLLLMMVYSCFFYARKNIIYESQVEKIISVIIILGIVSCLYNFIVNIQYFKLKDLSQIMFYTWNFSSFYFTRATYGIIVSFSAIASLMRLEATKKKVYVGLYVLFVCNVLITGARAQMLAVIIGSMIYLMYSEKFRKYVIFSMILLLVFLIISGSSGIGDRIGNVVNKYSLFFSHDSGGKTDITTGRTELWKYAFSKTTLFSFLFGHGLGSKNTIMQIENVQILGENLTSFHSGYVDLFFETGILGIAIYCKIIKETIVRLKCGIGSRIRFFYYSIISIVLISNIFDSNNLFFTTDVFSPVISVLIIAIPNAIKPDDVSLEE